MKVVYFLPIGVTTSANVSSFLVFDEKTHKLEFIKYNPKKVIVILIFSQINEMKNMANKIKNLFNEFFNLYIKSKNINTEIEFKYCQISDENDINKIINELNYYFEKIKDSVIYNKEKLDEKENIKIIANITTGTKSMAVGLTLFLLNLKLEFSLNEIELIYLGGKIRNYEGKSIKGEILIRYKL